MTQAAKILSQLCKAVSGSYGDWGSAVSNPSAHLGLMLISGICVAYW